MSRRVHPGESITESARVVDDVQTKANVSETIISPVDTILAYLPLSERRLTAGKGGEGERDALLVC